MRCRRDNKEGSNEFNDCLNEPTVTYQSAKALEPQKQKISFEEAAAACNGIGVNQFMNELRNEVHQWYEVHE